MNPCKGKTFCLKQVNPLIPGVYLGRGFEYDPNFLGCSHCQMGLGASYVYDGPLPKKEGTNEKDINRNK